MKIQFNEKGETIIPERYRWCSRCEAITPHKLVNEYSGEYQCKICDHKSYSSSSCPKCGHEESEDFAESREVIRHGDGCHDNREDKDGNWKLFSHSEIIFWEFKKRFMWKSIAPDRESYTLPRDNEWYYANKNLHKLLKNYKEKTKCQCPRFTIYQNINQIVTDGGEYFNGDYVTHWFEYKVRCSICGHIYENGDSD